MGLAAALKFEFEAVNELYDHVKKINIKDPNEWYHGYQGAESSYNRLYKNSFDQVSVKFNNMIDEIWKRSNAYAVMQEVGYYKNNFLYCIPSKIGSM